MFVYKISNSSDYSEYSKFTRGAGGANFEDTGIEDKTGIINLHASHCLQLMMGV